MLIPKFKRRHFVKRIYGTGLFRDTISDVISKTWSNATKPENIQWAAQEIGKKALMNAVETGAKKFTEKAIDSIPFGKVKGSKGHKGKSKGKAKPAKVAKDIQAWTQAEADKLDKYLDSLQTSGKGMRLIGTGRKKKKGQKGRGLKLM